VRDVSSTRSFSLKMSNHRKLREQALSGTKAATIGTLTTSGGVVPTKTALPTPLS